MYALYGFVCKTLFDSVRFFRSFKAVQKSSAEPISLLLLEWFLAFKKLYLRSTITSTPLKKTLLARCQDIVKCLLVQPIKLQEMIK